MSDDRQGTLPGMGSGGPRKPSGGFSEFDWAHARLTDPETSQEAAASLSADRLKRQRLAVFDKIERFGPMTDSRLVALLPHDSPSGVRTRRAELVRMGLVEDSGERETLASGRKSIVWRKRHGA